MSPALGIPSPDSERGLVFQIIPLTPHLMGALGPHESAHGLAAQVFSDNDELKSKPDSRDNKDEKHNY